MRPAPLVMSKNYENGTAVKRVFLGHTLGVPRWINGETEEEVRQRLLTSIECREYQIVEEGRGSEQSVESDQELNVFTNKMENVAHTVSHPYIWVRYRCK